MSNHFGSQHHSASSSTAFLSQTTFGHRDLPFVEADEYACLGADFTWNIDWILDSYPSTIHRSGSRFNPGYNLLSIDVVKSVLRVRSKRCTGRRGVHGTSCSACLGLGPEIDVVRSWAEESAGKKPNNRLSHNQLTKKLDTVNGRLQKERLKLRRVIISKKSLDCARKKIMAFKILLDRMSSNDVPGLPRLLSTGKKEGWGISKIDSKVALAIEGKYHPRNYTDLDIDLAMIIYELGGGAALHALNKAPISLPSRYTIMDARREISLRITVGSMLFKNVDVGEYDKVLHTLSQDEIAGDGRLCYLEDTDEIAGLCEHAITELTTFKMGSDLTSVHAAAKAVREGRIHVGKEFSVAAFARHAPTDYGAKPVLLMPTCKHGSWRAAATNLQKLLAAWKLSPYGESLHGPVKSIASDADPTRKAALNLLCMYKEVKSDDPLFPHVSGLPGLNLFTGEDGLTIYDPKHTWKRLRKCLLSKIIIASIIINKNLIACWLERLTGHDWSGQSIHALLNPKDPQNVSNAVKLLLLITDVRHLDSAEFTSAESKTHRAFYLLGEMLHYLLEPFVNPVLSLSEQLTSLVKFAHITCALFLQNESDFIPSQLYGDLQCLVKNVIFMIAHSKILNPFLKVFLCLLGDDVLKILFGRSRMIGGHSPNMAIDELRRRFGSALRLDDIYRRRPHLEKLARRLMLVRSRDVDHLSPRNYVGDITAGSCNTHACFFGGRTDAVDFLAKFGLRIDFDKLFRQKDTDLMRPKGSTTGGKYPGVSKEVDRSLADAVSADISNTDPDDTPESNPSVAEEILGFNAAAAVEEEEKAMELQMSEPHSVWIKLDDTDDRKVGHKKSILRTLMDPTLDIDSAKSHDRLLRIRCFSIGGDHWDRSAAKVHDKCADQHLLKLEGLFATLVAINTTKVSLAVLHCTVIKSNATNPPTYLDAAPIAEISLADTKYEVTGQILSLVPFTDSSNNLCWAWSTDFVAFESAKAKQVNSNSAARMRHLSICVNGQLILPLSSPDLMATTAVLEDIAPDVMPDVADSLETTWLFSNSQLDAMKAALLARVEQEEVRQKIPLYGPVKNGRYPYETEIESTDGNTTRISHRLPSVTAPSSKEGHRKCLVSLIYPCGFCGKSTANGACTIGIRGSKAISSCTEVYEFQISAASKSSGAKPCTNGPVRCPLCCGFQWKYNMETHLRDSHPNWQLTATAQIRETLETKLAITHSEECRLGVPQESMLTSPDTQTEEPSPGDKRPANSPAGTPRRSRVLRTTRTAHLTDVDVHVNS
ncbi:hypothetical protein B0H19DRAFT_1069490 [Mycena capillaripes]|nr:hypothetical protein B0H19DRAFT_1069490 [Mycena capillaripes]